MCCFCNESYENYETLEVCGQSWEEFMVWCQHANDSFADFPMHRLIKNSTSVILRPTFWCLEQTVVDMTHCCAHIQEEHMHARMDTLLPTYFISSALSVLAGWTLDWSAARFSRLQAWFHNPARASRRSQIRLRRAVFPSSPHAPRHCYYRKAIILLTWNIAPALAVLNSGAHTDVSD